MLKIFQLFIDFIFPPSEQEILIRMTSKEKLYFDLPRSDLAEYPFIFPIFSYKNPTVRELVWQIKYKKNKKAIECAGYGLSQELNKIYGNTEDKKIFLIPIPISKSRRKERGYNQCELIIDEILENNKHKENFDNIYPFTKVFDLLIRTKDIEKQTHKNRNERLENTLKIFEVNEKVQKYLTQEYQSQNIKIIIIDDVTTTGSTLREARNTLIEAGFVNVEAVTLAH